MSVKKKRLQIVKIKGEEWRGRGKEKWGKKERKWEGETQKKYERKKTTQRKGQRKR